jgi:hypothetical protein
MSIGHHSSFHNILVVYVIWMPVADVLIDGGSKQIRFLGHNSNFATQPRQIYLTHIHAIQQNLQLLAAMDGQFSPRMV